MATSASAVRLVPVSTSVGTPVDIAAPKGAPARQVYVVAQEGRIWIVNGTSRRSQPFLDVRGRISSGGERGLLGLAFHPNYAANGRFFVNYTDTRGDTNIVEFRRSANPNRANPNGTVILKIAQPFSNHNGGGLAFGPDGMLYVAMGDGGSGGDPQGHGQRLNTLLGKILRVNVSSPGRAKVPAGNPFIGRAGAKALIWHYGLRNPWRISFDRVTGDLWMGDVGQNAYEEIDRSARGVGGLNFGWNTREGRHPFGGGNPPNGRTVDPVVEYEHAKGCSVTGGFVYRGTAIPSLVGKYLFADYCSGRVWTVDAKTGKGFREITGTLGRTLASVASFGEDAAGELYVAAGSTVYRFAP